VTVRAAIDIRTVARRIAARGRGGGGHLGAGSASAGSRAARSVGTRSVGTRSRGARSIGASSIVGTWLVGAWLLAGCRGPVGDGATTPADAVSPSRAGGVGAAVAIATGPTRADPQRVADPCDGGHIGALSFAPGDASMVMGLDLAALSRHPEYVARRGALEHGEVGRWIAAADACGLGRDTWRTATFAGEPGLAETAVAIVRASGIGERDRVQCMRDRLADSQGNAPFTIVEGASPLELRFGDGRRAWAVNVCTLVLAGAPTADAVRARIDGDGKPLLAGPIGTTVARAGEHHHIWVAFAPAKGNTAISGLVDWSTGIDLHRGFAVDAVAQFVDAQAAATFSTQLRQGLEALRSGGFSPLGPRLLEMLSVGATDRFMTLSIRGDARDLASILDAIVGATTTPSIP
jgi:hypothetical protein